MEKGETLQMGTVQVYINCISYTLYIQCVRMGVGLSYVDSLESLIWHSLCSDSTRPQTIKGRGWRRKIISDKKKECAHSVESLKCNLLLHQTPSESDEEHGLDMSPLLLGVPINCTYGSYSACPSADPLFIFL